MFGCTLDQRNGVAAREGHVLKGSSLFMMGLTRTCTFRKSTLVEEVDNTVENDKSKRSDSLRRWERLGSKAQDGFPLREKITQVV